MSHLETQNLTYVYGEGTPFKITALDNVNIYLEKGEFVAIIGHTGSGKSTLVQHLNGLLKASNGCVLLDGKNIHDSKQTLFDARFRVGLCFQYPEYQLFESTVYKDIAFGPTNMGLSEAEIDDRVRSAAKYVGIPDEMLAKSPFDLSGGEKRRVAIAGVISMEPEILILDEPTAGLDPKERVRFRNIISSLAQNRTVILSTHIVSDIETIATKVVMIKDHKLLCSSTVEEVCSTLKGKLYEQDSRIKLSKNDLFISERQDANCIQNRFVSLNPPEGAVPVTPNLEDVFLYIYREGV